MAVARDTSTTLQRDASTSTITRSITIGSGDNRILIAYCRAVGSGDFTSVKWNGTDLTLLTTQTNATDPARVYYLLAPESGTYNLVFVRSGNLATETAAACYTGVEQAAPNFADFTGASGNITGDLTTSAAGSWLMSDFYVGGSTTPDTTGTNYAELGAEFFSDARYGDSNTDVGAAGSKNVTIGPASNGFLWDLTIVEIQDIDAPPPAPANVKTKNGIATANIKTINGIDLANVKTINGIA